MAINPNPSNTLIMSGIHVQQKRRYSVACPIFPRYILWTPIPPRKSASHMAVSLLCSCLINTFCGRSRNSEGAPHFGHIAALSENSYPHSSQLIRAIHPPPFKLTIQHYTSFSALFNHIEIIRPRLHHPCPLFQVL